MVRRTLERVLEHDGEPETGSEQGGASGALEGGTLARRGIQLMTGSLLPEALAPAGGRPSGAGDRPVKI